MGENLYTPHSVRHDLVPEFPPRRRRRLWGNSGDRTGAYPASSGGPPTPPAMSPPLSEAPLVPPPMRGRNQCRFSSFNFPCPFSLPKIHFFPTLQKFPLGSMGMIALYCVLYDVNLLVCDSEALLLHVRRFSSLYRVDPFGLGYSCPKT